MLSNRHRTSGPAQLFRTIRVYLIPVPNHKITKQKDHKTISYSWRIGNIFGVPTDLHWTFLLLPLAIGYFTWLPGVGIMWAEALKWTIIALLLFSFVLVHELGHALAARNRGVVAERIILFPLGGGAYLPERPTRLWDEVFVYAAGPLANIGLAVLAYVTLVLRPDGELLIAFYLRLSGNLVVFPGWIDQALGLTLAVNLLLAIGNLLPAYPLDGGRILRALLRGPLGARPATVVVTILGVIIGSVLIWLGYRLGDPLLGLGAVFVIVLSVLEYRNGWQRRRLEARGVAEVLRPFSSENRLFLTDEVRKAKAMFARTQWPVLPVYNQWNEQVGFVETEALNEEAKGDTEALLPFCEAEFATAKPDEDLLAITERIVDANVYGATIYGKRGRVLGYVFTEDVMTILEERRW